MKTIKTRPTVTELGPLSAAIKNFGSRSRADQLLKQYIAARDEYYNTGKKTTLTDAQYDKLEEEVKKHFPKEVAKTGILGKKKPIALAVAMPSLEKCKSLVGNVDKFLKRIDAFDRTSRVVMDKLDGASVQAVYDMGSLVSLATRGDGITGQDITFLASYCTTLPQRITRRARTVVRMEAVMSKGVFKKYAKELASGRAAVSGALNRTDASPILNDIDFVALRLLEEAKPLHDGLVELEKLGFMVVKSSLVKNPTDKSLTKMVTDWKAGSAYEIDGLVVHANVSPLPTEAKPKFAFAYKLDEDVETSQVTTITDIVWKKSAFNVLVPKAIIKPIKFDGVTVTKAALHNFAWAKEMQAGIGATVRVIRSGDIIPKIIRVDKGEPIAKPSTKEFGSYTFDGTNLVVDDTDNNHKELLNRFFRTTGLDGFGPVLASELGGSMRQEWRSRQHTSPTWVVPRMTTAKHWLPHTGESVKTSEKLAKEVVAMREHITLEVAMAASGVFDKGMGKTRILSLLKAYPLAFDLLTIPYSTGNRLRLMEKAAETKGCGPAFAKVLGAGLRSWCKWYSLSELDIQPAVLPAGPITKSKYTGKLFSFTGYRDKAQEAEILQGGGQVVSLGSKTNVLFYNPAGKFMAKVSAAKERGITVVTWGEYAKAK